MEKRITSFLMALALCLSLLPTTALANDPTTDWAKLNDALNGTTTTSVDGVFRVNSIDPLDITLLTNIVAGTGDTLLTIPANKTVTLRLEGHTIDRNLAAATENGSAISVENGATLGVLGPGTITGGKTLGNGGGICNSGTLNLYGGTISGNTATLSGGGIYNTGTINTSYYTTTISNNTASTDGGGIYTTGGALNLYVTTTINNNKATGKGGGIYTANYVDFRSGTTVTGCEAQNGGGVYVANNGWVENNGGKITDNTATEHGGGVYVEHGGTATFGNNASVKKCTAAQDGGAIYSKGAVGLETAAISGNTVTGGNGGGIYLGDGGSIFLGKDAKVTENTKNGAANNLYLCDNILKVKFGTGEDVPAPTSKMSIGVTTQTAPTAGNPVKLTENDTEDYKGYITPDHSDYDVAFVIDHLELQVTSARPAPSSHGGSYTPGHTVASDLNNVTKVTIDGKVVDSKYYTVSGGNVYLTDEFMKTLTNGSHTVKLYDGAKVATGTITVSGNAAVTAPKTADAGIALYGVLTVSSLLGMGWLGKKKH